MDAYLFFNERAGKGRWASGFCQMNTSLNFPAAGLNMHWCVWERERRWQSCIRGSRTHTHTRGRRGTRFRASASTTPHFFRQCARSEFSSPSHQGRETPFSQHVEIQTNQAPCETRLILAQSSDRLAVSPLGRLFHGQIQRGWAYTRRRILIVGKMQDKRFVSEGAGLRVQPEMGVFSSSHTRTGNAIFSGVQQQDYSAMIWLKRRDKLERVSLSADIELFPSAERASTCNTHSHTLLNVQLCGECIATLYARRSCMFLAHI